MHESYTGFIVAAYVVATSVIVSMIAVIVSDHRSLRRALDRFGSRGADNRE